MDIKTKYGIGQRIWIVYKNKGEVNLYCEPIINIVIDENGFYYCTDNSYDEIEEEDIILEDDKDKLFEKIKQLMKEIDEEENDGYKPSQFFQISYCPMCGRKLGDDKR